MSNPRENEKAAVVPPNEYGDPKETLLKIPPFNENGGDGPPRVASERNQTKMDTKLSFSDLTPNTAKDTG